MVRTKLKCLNSKGYLTIHSVDGTVSTNHIVPHSSGLKLLKILKIDKLILKFNIICMRERERERERGFKSTNRVVLTHFAHGNEVSRSVSKRDPWQR